LAKISSIEARVIYNSRGSKTIEVDVKSDGKFLGRVCAPSGASVGKYEAVSFPDGKPEESLRILSENAQKFIGLDSSDLRAIHNTLKSLDNTNNYSIVGGGLAFAVTIAAMESAAKAADEPLFKLLSSEPEYKFPFPLGNILGGGAHAGPGTPDIQEILICSTGSKTIEEAIETNLAVHKELRKVLEKADSEFTNGRGDEGGWAPKLENHKALEVSVKACENLGFTLGKEVSLGVDFASSTQWDEKKEKYVYQRAGFENSTGEQIDFAADIIEKYKLIYAEDAVHEEAFEDMSELTAKFPNVLITGDDLTVTNRDILKKAIDKKTRLIYIETPANPTMSVIDIAACAEIARKNKIPLVVDNTFSTPYFQQPLSLPPRDGSDHDV